MELIKKSSLARRLARSAAWAKRLAQLMVCASPLFSVLSAVAQQPSALRLSQRPRFILGADERTAFHRVSGGAALSDGTVAVADGGNYRVAVFSASGQLMRTFGKAGDGPPEFRFISSINTTSDTLIIHDGLRGRTTVWTSAGKYVRGTNLPRFDRRRAEFQGVIDGDRYVLTIFPPTRQNQRFQRQPASVGVFHSRSGRVDEHFTQDVRYNLFYAGQGATTTYRLPYLGSALFAGFENGYAFVPLDSNVVQLFDIAGRRTASIRVPVRQKPFDQTAAGAYRDSLLKISGTRTAHRVRAAFQQMPTIDRAPSVSKMINIGGELWIQKFPERGQSVQTWYVIDPAKRSVIGEISFPTELRLLGGNRALLLLLRRDDLGVETIEGYSLLRSTRG